MSPPKSHTQLRRKVCAICYLENNLKATRPISAEEERVIRKFISPDFSLHDEKYATGLCVECHFALHRLNNKLTDSIFISELFGRALPPALRSVSRCNCAICVRGRLSGPAFKTEAVKWKNERHNRVLFYPVMIPDAPDNVEVPAPLLDVPQLVPEDPDAHMPPEQEEVLPEQHQPDPALFDPPALPEPELDDLFPDHGDHGSLPVYNLNNNNNNKNSDLEHMEVESSVSAVSPPPEYLLKNDSGQTLLHLNVQRPGREDKIWDMIARGHPLEIEDNEGCTPLHEAVRHKMFDYVMILTEAGANRDHMNKAGETPLIVACRHGCLNEMEYLCEAGVRISQSDSAGKTALHYLKNHLAAGRRPGCHPDYREPGVMVLLQRLVTMLERRATGYQMTPPSDNTAQIPGPGAPQMLPPRGESEHLESSDGLCSSCNIEIDTFDEFLNVPSFPVDIPPVPDTVEAAGDGSGPPTDTDHSPGPGPAPTPTQPQSSAARPRARALPVKVKRRDLCSYCFSQVRS